MEKGNKQQSRKKFLLASLGIMALAGSLKFLLGKKKKQTVKMLTEDGRLVEVDVDVIKKGGRKISNEEIHSWIKNKATLQ